MAMVSRRRSGPVAKLNPKPETHASPTRPSPPNLTLRGTHHRNTPRRSQSVASATPRPLAMALPPSRQRRAFAPPSPSYPTPTAHPPSQPRSPALLSDLPSRWRRARTAAATPLAQRLAMRALEVALLSLALFLVPACIQHFVRALDTTYEVVGRRARTSLDEVGWWRVGVGTGVLAAWHAVLVALSLRVIAGGGERGRRGKWSRVLGRVVVPGYLVVALVGFAYALATRMASPLVVPGQAYGHASTPHG